MKVLKKLRCSPSRSFLLLQRATHTNLLRDTDKYCVELVKQKDYEAYLSGLLVESQYRRAFFAIKAFDVETAMMKQQIPNEVSQSGVIRFQWWNDSLKKIFLSEQSAVIDHPVLFSLGHYIRKHNLETRAFERLLHARYFSKLFSLQCSANK